MSLVLEALRRQEAGNDAQAAVSLARADYARRRHRLWVSLFALAMAANIVLVAWFFMIRAEDPAGTTDQPLAERPAVSDGPDRAAPGSADVDPDVSREQPAAATAEEQVAMPVRTPAPPAPASLPLRTPAPVAPAPSKPAAAPARAQAPPTPARLSLDDLPADARARFPGLAFSTHVYSEDADLRAVVANGQRLTEGDRIRGVEVLEITERGVVLRFERYEVLVPIVTDWDAL